jgi:hypothetical protein
VVKILSGGVKSLLRKEGMEVSEDEPLGRVVACAPRISTHSRVWLCRYDPLAAAGIGHIGFIFTPLDARNPRILVLKLPEHVDAQQAGVLFPIR